jgi:phage tail sheath protein FI
MFNISPGVNVSEIDAATGIPAVSTTEAGMAGVFRWGPVSQRVLTTSEPDLVAKFQKPSNFNAETWFTASNFLGYGNQLHVVRVSDGSSAMAVFSGTTAPPANTQTILNAEHYDAGEVTFSANVAYVAKYPGDLGNSLRVSVCDSTASYNSAIDLIANTDIASTSNVAISVGSSVATISVGFAGAGTQATANAQAYVVRNSLQVGDNIKVGNSTIGEQFLRVADVGTVTGNSTISTFNVTLAEPYRLHTGWSSNTINRYWEFHSLVEGAPGTSDYVSSFGNTAAVDELHLVVVDDAGGFTGSPGTVLEVYRGLSRATNAKQADGAVNYYKTVINDNSKYLWWANDNSVAVSNTALNIVSATTTKPTNYRLEDGTDGSDEGTIALAKLAQGYDLLSDSSSVNVSFVMAGKARQTDGTTFVNYTIDNVSEQRKDCILFASPPKETVVSNSGSEVGDVVAFAETLRASSYAFLDSGYKYQYDKYNDIYRWIPLNGDMAGLAVRTDQTNDAWWSFAGLNRGHVKNVVKLAWNPNKAQRDILSKASVNAVINEKGEGTILFDDRTLLKKNSPFRAVNVRRLFIVLEKAIATDAKYMLFEFNDDFTRAQFRNRVVPYLRDIMGRRGITDFEVICDDTNNTPEIIDREEFVGDIYIKPNRAIRSIQLNFVAVRGSVSFNEIVGQF